MNLEYIFVLSVLVTLSETPAMEADDEVQGGYPSKSLYKKTDGFQQARFVLHECTDLRLLFCDREALKSRIRRGVCVVDNVSAALANEDQKAAREVRIDREIAVVDLLKKIGFERKKGVEWTGGQPQLRVVKRDAIMQSPLQSDTAVGHLNVEAFLKLKVEPGDFLIIATRS